MKTVLMLDELETLCLQNLAMRLVKGVRDDNTLDGEPAGVLEPQEVIILERLSGTRVVYSNQ